MSPVLEGLTVVSVEQAVSAPYATRQLADLGARVIKVERPGSGDFARAYDSTVDGLSSHFVWANRSKESIALDLTSAEGRTAIEALVAKADVFVQNLAPGAAERLGLGAAQLRGRHPSLIHCSISGYGPGGPHSAKKAYDLLIQCESGLLSITGTPEHMAKVGISVADIATGMYAYSGILTALLRRSATGQGATIEISMLEALAEWMGFPMYFTAYGGTALERSGVAHSAVAPYGPFPCRGGEHVFLGIQNEREWAVFCRDVLGRAELVEDPRFASNVNRVRHRQALDEEIARCFAGMAVAAALELLERSGIACARLRTMRELVDHEQLKARRRWRQVDSAVGPIMALVPPATLDGDEPVMERIPAPGEHTQAILAELGLPALS